jgi:UDP-N-acetylmuramyl pentapeptide synthase
MISLAGGADATAPASAKDGVDSKSEVSLGGHFVDQEALVANLKQYLDVGVTVLVKGSRGSRMERVVKALMPAPKSRRTAVQEHNS